MGRTIFGRCRIPGIKWHNKKNAPRKGLFMTRRTEGFTLIEILVVITILGILAALIVPRVMDRPDQARVTAARADVNAIRGALKRYRTDNAHYPRTAQAVPALANKP